VYYSDEERLAQRADKIADWLIWIDEVYANLISRRSETGSIAGFDDKPRSRPCEHRRAWMRGNLCLACENTNWRPLTIQEREEGLGIDPYAADLHRDRVVVVESTSRRKAREAAHIDNIIDTCKRYERVRAGLEVLESPEAGQLRRIGAKSHPLDLIIAAINDLRDRHPELYQWLSFDKLCRLLARIVSGRIPPAPQVVA